MLAIFCLRLACGLVGALPLLSPAQINPRFFRTHFLAALGLCAVAAVFVRETGDIWLWASLGGAMILALLGSVVWHVEGAPAGRALVILTVPALVAALLLAGRETWGHLAPWLIADDLSSAALLGTATTAMLMGHSYLIAPAMSLTPLLRLLAVLGAAILLRMAVAVGGLWQWTTELGTSTVETEMMLWLPARWFLGFVGPVVLGWMAWETARIRSTQSATGILYVVVIFCFLGELTALLLLSKTGFPL
jgi:hypothetical protein